MTEVQILQKISMMEAHLASAMQIATELRKVSGAATSGTPYQDSAKEVLPVAAQAKLRAKVRAKILGKSTIKH